MNPKYLIFLIVLFSCISCRKYIEVDAPGNATTNTNVFKDNTTAAAALTGIYTLISSNSFGSSPGFNSLSFFAGLSADEFTLFTGITQANLLGYYTNNLNAGTVGFVAGPEFWSNTYPILYLANSAIEGLTRSTTISQDVKQQLLGEAKFIRALSYFYLTNLYGDVPLVLTTDVRTNVAIERSSQQVVYQQIISDLKEAQQMLTNNYVTADARTTTIERTRPNKWAATALLSRVYLYNKDWQNAEDQASALISQQTMYDIVSFSSTEKVFDKNSKEAIWQLQSVKTGENTPDANLFVLPATGPDFIYPVYLSDTLTKAFDAGDKRKINWINSVTVNGNTYYYPYKYKENTPMAAVTEYVMVLRLAEQFLIRAEARAQLNKIASSQADLNVIRTRAGIPNTTANDKVSLLTAIINERQLELFTEWGHRWFDLKRTDKADAIMGVITPLKGGTWEVMDKLYPIPVTDILRNKNLQQNQGY